MGAWIEILVNVFEPKTVSTVAPLVGAWIEIPNGRKLERPGTVAPLVGAWIEICVAQHSNMLMKSLLSWERGLKFMASQSLISTVKSLLSWERGLKSSMVQA